MIHVDFDENAIATQCKMDFQRWKADAVKKTAEATAAIEEILKMKAEHDRLLIKHQWSSEEKQCLEQLAKALEKYLPYEFDSKFWGKVKPGLYYLFHGKCAYCQKKIIDIEEVQVEHYRPKGKVEENENHPGYYWLAYKLINYFPSCGRCNGTGAKGTKFPVVNDKYAYKLEELVDEQPLLLNPYLDYPDRDDLDIILEGSEDDIGKLRAKTEKGEKTIEVFKLNRDGLRKARADAIKDCNLEFHEAIRPERLRSGALAEYRRSVNSGKLEFSFVRKMVTEQLTDAFIGQARP